MLNSLSMYYNTYHSKRLCEIINYFNTIKVDLSMVTFTTKVNFLYYGLKSLIYCFPLMNGKYYISLQNSDIV